MDLSVFLVYFRLVFTSSFIMVHWLDGCYDSYLKSGGDISEYDLRTTIFPSVMKECMMFIYKMATFS
jgi:hypothetical protein